MGWKNAGDIVGSVLPGETVLLEYVPSYVPDFTLKFFVDYSRSTDIPLLIDDNFDTLHTLKTHLEKLGVEIDLRDVPVVKTGGKKRVGNVLATVRFHPDPRVYIREYERALKPLLAKVQDKPFINLAVGVEHLFLLSGSVTDSYSIILTMQKFVGNTRRRAFYLINRGLLRGIRPGILHELERVATTIMDMEPMPTGVKIRILKSPLLDNMGRTTIVDVGGEVVGRA